MLTIDMAVVSIVFSLVGGIVATFFAAIRFGTKIAEFNTKVAVIDKMVTELWKIVFNDARQRLLRAHVLEDRDNPGLYVVCDDTRATFRPYLPLIHAEADRVAAKVVDDVDSMKLLSVALPDEVLRSLGEQLGFGQGEVLMVALGFMNEYRDAKKKEQLGHGGGI